MVVLADQSPDVDVSDDDEQEYSSNDDLSDSEPIPGDDERRTWSRKFMQGLNRPAFSRGVRVLNRPSCILSRGMCSECTFLPSHVFSIDLPAFSHGICLLKF